MRREFACCGIHHLVAQRGEVEAVEQGFAAAERDRGHCEVEFVDQTGLQVLMDRGDAPPILTSLPLAASRAWSRAARIPSVMKCKTVPPSITIDWRG